MSGHIFKIEARSENQGGNKKGKKGKSGKKARIFALFALFVSLGSHH